MHRTTLGVIIGNRDFFPDHLVAEGRRDILAVLGALGIGVVILSEEMTKLGAVETWQDAKKCAALFKQHSDQIDGILISLPNFGDEKAVSEAVKLSGLRVPILVQAYPDDLDQLVPSQRRDAYCGKISVCNNLYQYGLPFTLSEEHTVHPRTEGFRAELERFIRICRVVKGMRSARLGAVGARPNAFNTTRYSEKILQDFGISVQTLDLSDVLGPASRLPNEDARVNERLDRVRTYVNTRGVPGVVQFWGRLWHNRVNLSCPQWT
ncbi:MAG: hypothetical protein K6V36_11270 [Anaerolineae bacterium]|nr:hypothetical protein [Anaerolineae bacterium]